MCVVRPVQSHLPTRANVRFTQFKFGIHSSGWKRPKSPTIRTGAINSIFRRQGNFPDAVLGEHLFTHPSVIYATSGALKKDRTRARLFWISMRSASMRSCSNSFEASGRLAEAVLNRYRRCRDGLTDVPEFNDHAFRVLALRALESPKIESRFSRINLRKIHLRAAFWAPRAIIHIRLCRRVFELRHVRLPLITGGSATELSATDAWRKAAAGDGTKCAPSVDR